MDIVSTTDTLYFVLGGLALMLMTDPRGFVVFVTRVMPHLFFRVPQDVVYQRLLRPYDERPEFNRKASTFEWVAVMMMQWMLTTFQPNGPVRHFFGRAMAKSFYLFRKYRLGHAGLGDSTYEEIREDGHRGFWICSPTRGDLHDVVIYYVHGGGFTNANGYFYMEYLLTLLVSLQLQGFRNPAIYAIDYDHVPKVTVAEQLTQVANGWDFLTQGMGMDNVVLVGDSNGATLVLTLMLHIVHPYEGSRTVSTKPPAAAVVISPFTKLGGPWMISDSDYLSERALSRYMQKYAIDPQADSTDPHVSPGLCRSKYWWSKAIPPRGLYLMYGEDETLAGEVEELYQMIKDLGRVARDIEPNQVHAWPVVSHHIGRTKPDRARGVDKVSNNVARMMLWHTSTEASEEVLRDLNKERYAIQRYLQDHHNPSDIFP